MAKTKKGTEDTQVTTERKANKKAAAKKAAGLFAKLGEIMHNPLAAPASADHHSGLSNGFIDTGCYILNALISGSMYGGFPGNHITALAGAPSTGKTYFALTAVKRFLDKNPDGYVLYVETEGAVYKEMLEEWEIDTERCIIVPLNTVEELKHQLSNFIASYREEGNAVPCFVVLDSAGMLSTTKEVTDALEGKQARDMTRAQLLRGAMRILTYPLRQAKVPFLFTNHTYDVPGAYVPTKNMAGGDGLVYAASVVLELDNRRLKEGHKDIATKEFTAKDAVGAVDKKSKDVVANVVKVKLKKGRFTRDGKELEVYLDHRRGLLPYYGLVEFGLAHGVLKKEGNYVHFPSGAKGFVSAINTNPEEYFTDDVMAKLEEACIREFTFKGRLTRAEEVVDVPVEVEEETTETNE